VSNALPVLLTMLAAESTCDCSPPVLSVAFGELPPFGTTTDR
jgi:hypothetical protein